MREDVNDGDKTFEGKPISYKSTPLWGNVISSRYLYGYSSSSHFSEGAEGNDYYRNWVDFGGVPLYISGGAFSAAGWRIVSEEERLLPLGR